MPSLSFSRFIKSRHGKDLSKRGEGLFRFQRALSRTEAMLFTARISYTGTPDALDGKIPKKPSIASTCEWNAWARSACCLKVPVQVFTGKRRRPAEF